MTEAERQLPDYELIQEKYSDDPWKILVCAILVRRARGSVAKAIASELFRRFPTACDYWLFAKDDDIFTLLKPLGFGNVRTAAIRKLTSAYVELPNPYDLNGVATLPEVGNYALESYAIFVLGMTDILPDDAMLQYYLKREKHL